MNLFTLALFIVLVYLCIYSIVNRICECVEKTAMAKSYGEYMKNVNDNQGVFSENFKKMMNELCVKKQVKTNDQKDN